MKILVVDDDPKYRAFVARGLSESGMVPETAGSGEEGLARLREHSYDLALLDVMMPGIQGWDLIEAMRAEGIDRPVIFVTARDALDERIKGLHLGGDDYVVKPFAFAELVARIHAVLRRRREGASCRVGDLEIDYIEGKVTRGGVVIDLTRTEFTLLRQLAEHEGETVTRASLLHSVWGMDFDPETNLVDVHILRLRKKVDEPFENRLIHTVRGAGYVLEARG